MKKTIFLIFLLLSKTFLAQKHFTRTGNTSFKASVETFEPVEAVNNSTTVILKTDSGDIAVQLFITAFKFKVALMQEHFNENYMDSDEYPKATFRGKLDDFYIDKISTKKDYSLKGILTIRGIEKNIETVAKITFKDDKIKLVAEFLVKPQDFDIKIPKIVRKKIADQINVSLNYELSEKK